MRGLLGCCCSARWMRAWGGTRADPAFSQGRESFPTTKGLGGACVWRPWEPSRGTALFRSDCPWTRNPYSELPVRCLSPAPPQPQRGGPVPEGAEVQEGPRGCTKP